ncbi:MAG TPA: nitroreductase/quinone reductase family protein [Streptosporangiaceae bacterium]
MPNIGDIRGRSQELRQPERRRDECHIHSPDQWGYNRGMRSRKYRLVTTLERGSNRLISLALRAGFAPQAFAMLETTGRRTGLPRHTPVGNGLLGNTFWLIAAHGTQADYVRNLQAEPTVRVKAGGVWRSGTAVLLPGDDPAARSRTLPHQWDAAIGRLMASTPLTIRIDLDPDTAPARRNGVRPARGSPVL